MLVLRKDTSLLMRSVHRAHELGDRGKAMDGWRREQLELAARPCDAEERHGEQHAQPEQRAEQA